MLTSEVVGLREREMMAQLRNVGLASLIYGFKVLGKYVDMELLSPDYIKDMAILTQHEMTSTCFI